MAKVRSARAEWSGNLTAGKGRISLESGAFDGILDFDAVVRDPGRPSHLAAAYDSGDHLHPNDAGYQAMAESIDLRLLSKR